jgi:hypothetical protein
MPTMTRLEPPIELDTPRGRAEAYFVIDYSTDGALVWVCFQKDTGECWSYKNPLIRMPYNETMQRGRPTMPGIPKYSEHLTDMFGGEEDSDASP